MLNLLTQLTTGGKSEADIAMPIKGPALPCRRARATPVPEVKAQSTPIHNERTFPLKVIIIIFYCKENLRLHNFYRFLSKIV